MSRIASAFSGGKAFIGFLTGGDPTLEKTLEYALALERGGAGLIEIGVPFSDPVAEGPVIQRANIRALRGGATLDGLFALALRLRRETRIPLVFLTYANPAFRRGWERFFDRCAGCGVDGVIIPDLPFEEQDEARGAASARGVDLISLVAPSSQERVRRIACAAEGFLYIVSSPGVTGIRQEVGAGLDELVREARAASRVPLAVGFGIHTPEQAARVARLADGVIVGSAIVKIIEERGPGAAEALSAYARAMKAAIGEARGELSTG